MVIIGRRRSARLTAVGSRRSLLLDPQSPCVTAFRSPSVFKSKLSCTSVPFLAGCMMLWGAVIVRAEDPAPTKETPTKESSDAKQPGHDELLTDKDTSTKEEKKHDDNAEET